MNVLSLFSGIGGLDLGLERAGMTAVGQVEIDPFCRKVLAKHWPEVPRHDDVRTCVDWWRSVPRPAVHVVAGGFPCQPVSLAGRQRAQQDERWLWPAFAHVVRELRPDWVLLENVPGLLGRGMGDVLADLAACGYDAEWDCVPAAAVGAPHRRDRVFVVAHAFNAAGGPPVLAGRSAQPGRRRGDVADAPGTERRPPQQQGMAPTGWPAPELGERNCGGRSDGHWWATEPDVGRVADGVPARVDRLRALGNAAVPQVAEHIGRLIVAADQRLVSR